MSDEKELLGLAGDLFSPTILDPTQNPYDCEIKLSSQYREHQICLRAYENKCKEVQNINKAISEYDKTIRELTDQLNSVKSKLKLASDRRYHLGSEISLNWYDLKLSETKITPCDDTAKCTEKKCEYFHYAEDEKVRQDYFEEERRKEIEKKRKEKEKEDYKFEQLFYLSSYLDFGVKLKEFEMTSSIGFSDDLLSLIRSFCCGPGSHKPLFDPMSPAMDVNKWYPLFKGKKSVYSLTPDNADDPKSSGKPPKRCCVCDEWMDSPQVVVWRTHEAKNVVCNRKNLKYNTSILPLHHVCMLKLGIIHSSMVPEYLECDVVRIIHDTKKSKKSIPSHRDLRNWSIRADKLLRAYMPPAPLTENPTLYITTSLERLGDTPGFNWVKSKDEPHPPRWMFPEW